MLQSAILQFRADNGRIPTAAEGFDVLVHPTLGGKKYLPRMPIDSWARAYRYLPSPTGGFTISSDGRDGVRATRDDIVKVVTAAEIDRH